MERRYEIKDPKQVRSLVRRYLREVLYMTMKEFVKAHSSDGLVRNMLDADLYSKSTGKKGEKEMPIETLCLLCELLHLKLYIEENDQHIEQIVFDKTNPNHILIDLIPLTTSTSIQLAANTSLPDIRTLGRLVRFVTDRNNERTLILEFDYWPTYEAAAKGAIHLEANARILCGYLKNAADFSVMLDKGVYYVRAGEAKGALNPEYLNDLPDLLFVHPSGYFKDKKQNPSRFVLPFGIRIFHINKKAANGPIGNAKLTELGFVNVNYANEHIAIHFDYEVTNITIDQLKAADYLYSHYWSSRGYIPIVITLAALKSYEAIKFFEPPFQSPDDTR